MCIIMSPDDERYMNAALREAERAYAAGEVPVGAVVVYNSRIIAKSHNQTEQLQDATAHAEMLAITSAMTYIGGKYLSQCTLYVTLEPCGMCGGAMRLSQLKRLVFGAADPQHGYHNFTPSLLHPKTQVTPGVLPEPCSELIKKFFAEKRASLSKSLSKIV